MKKNEAIELIYLRVNGGKPTPDDSVMRADIKTYLPAAFNYAMAKIYNVNLQVENDRDFVGDFYSVFEGISIDRTGSTPFIPLTLGTVPLASGCGIRFVNDECGNFYAPIPDSDYANIKYYSKLAQGTYWYRRTGSRLYLYGINPLIEELNYTAITKVEDIADGDVLPLQVGMEAEILDMMFAWFGNKLPSDSLTNTRDVNANP